MESQACSLFGVVKCVYYETSLLRVYGYKRVEHTKIDYFFREEFLKSKPKAYLKEKPMNILN